MKNKAYKKGLLGLSIMLVGGSLYAADLPEGRSDVIQRQELRDEALKQQLQPEVSVNLGLEKQLQTQTQRQYLKSHSEEICFDIKKFVLIGEDARNFYFCIA